MFNDRVLRNIFRFGGMLVFAIVFARLFYLQVIKHNFYDNMVSTQSSINLTVSKNRGLIYDRNGVPLVQNRRVASIYTFGKNVENPDAFIKKLSSFGIKLSASQQKDLKSKDSFMWLSRRIDIDKAKQIKKAIPDVGYYLEESRFYPEKTMLSGVIGFTGVDNQGLSGVEYLADKQLAGEKVTVATQRDSRGKVILFDDKDSYLSADSAVYLTPDSVVQGFAEKVIREETEKYGAKHGLVIAMDVKTGEIIAAASSMDYDLGSYQAVGPDHWKNYMTTYLFEPGSIFKSVTFSYLMENGYYKPNEKINVGKDLIMHGHKFRDVHKADILTQEEVFTNSSNIGTVQLINRTQSEHFYNYLVKAGFGSKTNAEGMVEEDGLLRNFKNWSGLSKPSISIGQEILVTPLQMVRFYAAVANNGVAVRPTVVFKYDRNGKVITPVKQDVAIMSEATADSLLKILAVTVGTGTGQLANTGIVKVGGKTGTAQTFDQKTKKYSKTDYVASFAGVFPLDNPKVAMVVVFENPRSSIYGGSTAAKTFKLIAEQMAFSLDIGDNKTKVQYVNR